MKEYIVQAYARETINSFDAHNAPELVRCKDCFACKNSDNVSVYCAIYDRWFYYDHFCSDGMRKKGDNHDT